MSWIALSYGAAALATLFLSAPSIERFPLALMMLVGWCIANVAVVSDALILLPVLDLACLLTAVLMIRRGAGAVAGLVGLIFLAQLACHLAFHLGGDLGLRPSSYAYKLTLNVLFAAALIIIAAPGVRDVARYYRLHRMPLDRDPAHTGANRGREVSDA